MINQIFVHIYINIFGQFFGRRNVKQNLVIECLRSIHEL